jgi:hypothetical protein
VESELESEQRSNDDQHLCCLIAVGGVIWGFAAQVVGLDYTLVVAAVAIARRSFAGNSPINQLYRRVEL